MHDRSRADRSRFAVRACITRAAPSLAAAFLASVFAACASAAGGAAGTATMGEAEVREQAAMLAMFDTRSRDTVLIDRVLASNSPVHRARAALLIGQNAVRARYGALHRLLVAADTSVAANAAYALGLAHDTTAVVALGRALAGAPDAVAREAAWSLGEIGEPARAVLTIALGEGSTQLRTTSTAALRAPDVRAELLLAVAKLRAVPITAILPWADDSADVVVRAVAYGVGRRQLAAGVRTLLSLSTHRDEIVRQHVARAMARTVAGDTLAARAREALGRLVTDVSPRVRANAARSVGSYGPAARADFDRVMSDADANVRVAAAENSGTVLQRDEAGWRAAWTRDTTYMVRRTLMAAARRAGSDALTALEESWATHADWRMRVAALEARALADTADRAALARTAMIDVDPRVRSAALGVPAASADDTSVRAFVRAALSDADAGVRGSAIGVMSRWPNASDLTAVLDAMGRSAGDADLTEAGLRYVAAAWDRDSLRLSPAQRLRITELPIPAEAVTRAIVTRVTPLARWRAADVAARPMAEYERIARRWLAPGARLPVAVLHTERGDITVDLLAADAPLVVDGFVGLANRGFYRNSRFHRVVPNFVAQDGDPRGDGSGGPGFGLRDAYTRVRHERGCLGLATSGPDTGGSQYYLCHSPQPHLDGHYTVFGRVRGGFEALDAIVQGDRVISVEIR